jgi:hypothetical protein
MNCINTQSKEYKDLLESSKLPSLLLEMRIAKWQEINGLDNFPTIDDIIVPNQVNFTLKSIDILSSDKAKQVFEKGKKAGWDLNKILTELQVPKEQKQIILDKYKGKISEQEFIKSIFPDTKVKQVVYHGTKNKDKILKEGFKNNAELYNSDDDRAYESGELGFGYYFTDTIENANVYGESVAVILNNPDITNETSFSLIENKRGTQFFVKTKEQIHILTKEEQSKIYNEDNLREEIITSLLADNSFVVEVKLNKEMENSTILLRKITDDSIKNSIFTIKNNLNNKTKEEIELDNYSKSISNLFNNKMGRITTQEVLNNLINANALNDYQKILVKSLLKGANSKIAFRTLSENIHMQYDTLTNTIIIDKEKFKLFSPEYITQIFLHEVFHDVLFHIINNPKNIDERMFVNLLKQEFNKFTELYDKYNSVAQETPYGFEDLDEFVSELMTNPKFKSLLLKLEYKNKSLLSRIAQLIRQLFGLKVDSSLDKLIEDILSLSEQSTYKGGLNMGVRNKKADPTDLYENLETTENKYNKIISRIEQSLNYNINNFTNIANRIRYYNEENANNWDKYITTLKTIRNNIVEFKDVEPLNSLTYFIDAMDSSLANIQKRLDGINYDDLNESIKTYEIYTSYLETYDVVNDVSKLIAFMKENKEDNNILTGEEIVNLEARLDYAKIQYSKLSDRFEAVRKNID